MTLREKGSEKSSSPYWIVISTVALFLVLMGSAVEKKTADSLFVPNGPMQDEQSFGDYVVRIYSMNDYLSDGSYEILRKGVRVHAAHGCRFRIGSIDEEDESNNLITIGSDITGDGRPNLVVSEWTGGAHCCFMVHLFEIGNRFRHIETINEGHGGCTHFENLDNDPALEFLMHDWTFAYWRTSFAGSPAPQVILKYKGKKYGMAHDLMRKPGIPHDELVQLANDIRATGKWEYNPPPVKLWDRMLDLIYTGNMSQAWTLFELTWPEGIGGKNDFLRDFKSQLTLSDYWNDLQILNRKETQQDK